MHTLCQNADETPNAQGNAIPAFYFRHLQCCTEYSTYAMQDGNKSAGYADMLYTPMRGMPQKSTAWHSAAKQTREQPDLCFTYQSPLQQWLVFSSLQ